MTSYGSFGFMGDTFAPVHTPTPNLNPQGQPHQGQPPMAKVVMPSMADLGQGWYSRPFFPTAPLFSTEDRVGHVSRFYSTGIVNQPAGGAVPTTVQFDLPCRVIAANASAMDTAAIANLTGVNPLSLFSVQIDYVTGERLLVNGPRIAATFLGSAERPGEIGGFGWTVNPGGAFIVTITPWVANLRIDIVFHVLELRGASNFTSAR